MSKTPSRDRIKLTESTPRPKRRPEWIEVSSPVGQEYQDLKTLMRSKELHTVCEEANCPNNLV